MIFPELKGRTCGYVNLNLEAILWLKEKGLASEKNPLIDPKKCEKFVESVHRKYGLDFSYGGWMEDRSVLWKGSYLDGEGSYVHLGIDLNAPSGTKVAADFDARVVRVDDDYPEDGGWGPRIILKHAKEPIYMIYAHLDRGHGVKKGGKIKAGETFARVGRAPYNGNWFPHLHVQVITGEHYARLETNGLWHELDGYGRQDETKDNARKFLDPLRFIRIF